MWKTFFHRGCIGLFLCLVFWGSGVAIAEEKTKQKPPPGWEFAPAKVIDKLQHGGWRPISGVYNNKPLSRKQLGFYIVIVHRNSKYDDPAVVEIYFGNNYYSLGGCKRAAVLQNKKNGKTMMKFQCSALVEDPDSLPGTLYKIEGNRLTIAWESSKNPTPKRFQKSSRGQKVYSYL